MKKIYEDAGHGLPNDPGAVGNGLKECEVVLTIQELFNTYLLANYEGFEIKSTRTDNKTFLPPSERARRANRWNADVFISFHINSATNEKATGYEDFIYKHASLASESLQNIVHEQVLPVICKHNVTNRGKKIANYAVLRMTNMPAILTETMFISNSKDAQNLKNIEFLKDFASAYAVGVAKFLGLKAKDSTHVVVPSPVQVPKKDDLPKVTSLGDKYLFQVKATKDIGVYKYANLAENFKTLKKGTVFSVYGYTEGVKAYAVPGGFVQAKDVEPLSVTLITGGLSKEMETPFRDFLKAERIDSELNLYAKGNPSAEITVSGLDLVKVKRFLNKNNWWYKTK
ncbi:N-acetylmuramoyl-L-alanine amidase [Priestia megaterium]|uniref:N-acetylmuramoyl-L-alanine amidase family protein n=1 Tax=Priestia megaterium TaxID=1404 RepID=UPI002E22A1C2|nr:N-acetylmuramoyl-L-alanine amidase [Priestia megaterium]MED4292393.1 N-acetylmuramoyl-L-alanine amidase [Priestia megaterium]MED4295158.1 N-acetylmuramoyl-L-alanine amidase [Priestia megaterium]